MGMFLSWRGALLYVTWGSQYGYLMKTYWKWREIMQYWYDSPTHRKKCVFQLFPLHARRKKDQKTTSVKATTSQVMTVSGREGSPVCGTNHRALCHVEKPIGKGTVQCSGILLFLGVQGETESGKRQSAYLECGAKSNSRTQHCWQK